MRRRGDKKLKMENTNGKIGELVTRKELAERLYEVAEGDADKIKLLELIGDLERKIREAQYKEDLMNGYE